LSSKLKHLSGSEVADIIRTFGFKVHSRKGSHVKLRRVSVTGERQTLTIPLHVELDAGTMRAIMRQAARYIPVTELRSYFYTD